MRPISLLGDRTSSWRPCSAETHGARNIDDFILCQMWPLIPFLLKLIIWLLRALFTSSDALVIEDLALRKHIFLSARYVLQVCRGYVNYYNGARPSQAFHAIADP